MSSAGSHGSGAAASEYQNYFCHRCQRTVSLPAAAFEIVCPVCHDDFLEEVEPPIPSPSPNSISNSASGNPVIVQSFASPFFSSSSPAPASFDLRQPSGLADLLGPEIFVSRSGPGAPTSATGEVPFNPMVFLQDYLQQFASGGANIQVVIGGGPDGGIGNIGDYFIGSGLEQLIQHLTENDPNRYGTPPAAKTAVANLPDIKISRELLASDEAKCSVCMDTFEMGIEAKKMPCKHIFHKDCILPWLELHNSCPVCRYELPTDDLDYEQRRGAPVVPSAQATAGTRDSGSVSGATAGAFIEGDSANPRMTERRFRISLPWPFRMFETQAEGSNADGRGNDGNNGSNAQSGRQEDGR
ncbi:E3 ubiquitin-protein ligase RING1-like [Zingiber officinale]|uniref:E3 ubiquitin-protein ligase RING1-like n=1 Tax=Zingiber officinale TaxID=94328 RepID=UPI001C4CCEC1|nr:E3 ubiquitin-protein ligase RING1-like [Zingiber officinale]XP_042420820.1 E3 ubiquitin-protein ligase RING1-like [Zingiber officinale]